MAKDWTKTKAYKELKQEMLDDLEVRGLISRPYIDKVEEYMELWAQLKMLNEDIRERGVSIEYQNGENQKGTTDNKSLGIAIRVSAQMLNIFSALGFRDQAVKAKADSTGGEDDEL
jgi:phage terminase small subunit